MTVCLSIYLTVCVYLFESDLPTKVIVVCC